MFKYLSEQQVPEQFKCVICLQICSIPIQCYSCLAIHCYQCIIQNKNQCGRGCRQKIKKAILKPKTVRNLEQIRCKCDICHEFISYKSYRKHTFSCNQINAEIANLKEEQQVASNMIKSQKVQKRISKFKLRRIIFPCLHLFEQQCSEQKERNEYFCNQNLKEFDKFFQQTHLGIMIENQIIKCENIQEELQNI
ncbi:hypothetical protein pb186bvf_000148 [Paramecium bursaria]